MQQKGHAIAAVIMGGLFLLFDQLLKGIARANPFFDLTWVSGWVGWDYFENPGVAFGLPIPNSVLLVVTPLILLGLVWLYGRNPTPSLRSPQDSSSLFATQKKKRKGRSAQYTYAFSLIFFGAISNYIDRILFEVTIDYLRFFTSVTNFADVMIVAGAGLLILCEMQTKKTSC